MIVKLWESRAVFTLAPMQDLLGLGTEARMNYPGTTSGNWQWRMGADVLNEEITKKLMELNQRTNR